MAINPEVPQSPASTPPSIAARAHTDCYALPRTLYDEGIRRYGFHGLSYEYIADRLPGRARGRGGASSSPISAAAPRCARCRRPQHREHHGLHRARRPADGHPPRPARPRRRPAPDRGEGHDAGGGHPPPLQRLRPQGPLRCLQRHARPPCQRRPRRRLRHRPFRPPRGAHAGELAAALGGLDAFVFTAGIGEHAPRSGPASPTAWPGSARTSTAANEAGATRISPPASRVMLLVVPTDEELMIARHTLAL